METDVTVDSSNVEARLGKLRRGVGPAAQFSTLDIAYELLRLTQLEVPHDEGTLQDSGVVEIVPGTSFVVLGYNTIYAARLHEHPEYRFQKGRKGKYIEDPIIANQTVLGLRWGTTFKQQTLGKL